jgi:hypothetical protein
MLKRTSLAILLAVAGCGDNSQSNFAPVLSEQAIDLTMPEDGTVTIDATAYDPEDQSIIYAASPPSHGTLTGHGPVYSYQPTQDFVGIDTLIVTVSDGDNHLMVPVKITITALDDRPVAEPQAISVYRFGSQDLTLTASDVDSDDLIYELVSPPSHGTLSGTPPALTYRPTLGYFGPDSFAFRASDTFLTSDAATVTITVLQSCNPDVASTACLAADPQ